MQRLIRVLAAVGLAFAGPAFAGESPVVVELYTSQGCSSCPPADSIFKQIAARPDVIALALHVDYWDYIGWKDSFANPKFSARQRAYAHAAGRRSIYTPQMIVDGVDNIVGVKPMKLVELVDAHRASPDLATVTVERVGSQVKIEAVAAGPMPSQGCVVQLVTYQPSATVEIGRGENAGRRLDYVNIVQEWLPLGEWNGQGTFSATAKVAAGTPVAVLVQQKGYGAILGAAQAN